ncbi:TetR/AcrR family transcriptional regulator [Planktotalea sp.]|uniref:TetR/AcrR family transcriptional regulator n=1 Tax=Planktotalea sp. TaxID=2029877 RepID=UPI00329688B9
MTDPRVARTQQDLFLALDELLSEKPFREISVSDLARRANVGRQTFYRHFESVGAMLNLRLETELEDQINSIQTDPSQAGEKERLRQITLFAFERVGAQPHIARAILSGEAGSNALASFREQIIALWAKEANDPFSDVPSDFLEYASTFYAGAMSATLQHWLDSDCSPNAETMSRLVVMLSNRAGLDWSGLELPSE